MKLLKGHQINLMAKWIERTLLEIRKNINPDCNFKVGKLRIMIRQDEDEDKDEDEDEPTQVEDIWFCYDDGPSFLRIAFFGKQGKDFIAKTMSIVLGFLASEYVFCKHCNEPVLEEFKKDLCKVCDVNEYDHNEECSICKEKGKGHWLQYTKCKHIVHNKCHKKMIERPRRCPLCRGSTSPEENYFGDKEEE